MAFRVYISHSVAPHELGAIYGVAELAAKKGMEPIVWDRAWDPATPPARIVQLLTGIDALVAIATVSGTHIDWINTELEEALRSGLNRENVISVLDEQVTPPPVGAVVKINRYEISSTIQETVDILERLHHIGQNQKTLLAGLILGGLAALLLTSKE